ncbi:ABC transporter substrate-binding protein [Pseudomonas aeruginosa]|uniref:ABC transporter substrate-binding protein n=1 Tax=Pseudomonas aeruginosa TaxID=287 RepID=UPI0012D9E583|nr:ABC transporter substrate-binding protein [Pseudomonas aeruginosa]MBH9461313.1 ABC transporter substrate-binding protein [Pseudomonas aeruginosa]MBH9468103.1 ABC transporter substrate-binding protein [Pseudomonas aeruginosa]MUI52144.1 ABC transporter substrate-binding protein [Pseudomonas aeruginosa]HBO3954692.1 ABC transporter substrate-binding protein [Pseudomonas aeruginosa]HCL3824636.1 ABC transporter substrate-binding protein [Pseudomonas aeruginosa]
MSAIKRFYLLFGLSFGALAPLCGSAAEVMKLGLSVPLSGAGANWGIGAKWLCEQAAGDVAAQGGVKVAGQTYNFECVAYDNKYNAADGAKVAQTLLSKDSVKFVAGSLGTAPVRALQSLSERRGALIFTTAWGTSIKGPKFPLTFTQMNTPNEIVYPLVKFVKERNPSIKTVVLMNPNDATGQETEAIARKAWEAVGVKVLASDWYERGTTEFQPVASKMASLKPDAVDLCSSTPADSGQLFKELSGLGWNGVKVIEVGTGAGGLLATGGEAASGTYMGAAVALDSPGTTDLQRRLNDGVKAQTGESINAIQIGFYDSVKALAAAMEKAQSVEPKAVAEALPEITFDSFYGKSAFGGKATYGTPQQILVPVIVTQLQQDKLVEVGRVQPEELTQRIQ